MRRIQIPAARLATLSTKKPCIREEIHAELPFEPVEPILGQCSGGEVDVPSTATRHQDLGRPCMKAWCRLAETVLVKLLVRI